MVRGSGLESWQKQVKSFFLKEAVGSGSWKQPGAGKKIGPQLMLLYVLLVKTRKGREVEQKEKRRRAEEGRRKIEEN